MKKLLYISLLICVSSFYYTNVSSFKDNSPTLWPYCEGSVENATCGKNQALKNQVFEALNNFKRKINSKNNTFKLKIYKRIKTIVADLQNKIDKDKLFSCKKDSHYCDIKDNKLFKKYFIYLVINVYVSNEINKITDDNLYR